MGQQQTQLKDTFFIYDDSHIIGYVESLMNIRIFQPPNKLIYNNDIIKPKWIKYIILPNKNKLSYFVIDPISNNKINDNNRKYILWSHGNSGDLISLYSTLKSLYDGMNGQVGFIAYDYEGYGYSDGICSERNCYNDLTCMIKHALTTLHINKNNLFLIGHSLGTGIVVDFCFRHVWETPIILISPYKSISRIKIDPHWTDFIINNAVNYLDMFTTHHKLHILVCPIIIYHGTKDELIPSSHSIEMYNNHKDKINLILIENANHSNILQYIRSIELLSIINSHISN